MGQVINFPAPSSGYVIVYKYGNPYEMCVASLPLTDEEREFNPLVRDWEFDTKDEAVTALLGLREYYKDLESS